MSNIQLLPSYKEELSKVRAELKEMLPPEELAVFDADAALLQKRIKAPLKVKAGDIAPAFELPNALGNRVGLGTLLEKGPVVLGFYRGAWCPYCNIELRLYQEMLPEIKEASASLVFISPQSPDQSLSLAEKAGLEFEVLSDTACQVAQRYVEVFKNSDAPIEAMDKLGYDFGSFYEDDSNLLPVPAIFIIGKDGIIKHAAAQSGDYRERNEPSEILEQLKRI